MSSYVQRMNIFSLYRTKLRLCLSMGHVYGKWNNNYIYKINHLSSKSNTKKINNYNNPGSIIWNNVRIEYKNHLHQSDSKSIDKLIDSGFIWLTQINNISKSYKKSSRYKYNLTNKSTL